MERASSHTLKHNQLALVKKATISYNTCYNTDCKYEARFLVQLLPSCGEIHVLLFQITAMLVKTLVMVRHLETASLLAPFKTYILFFPAYIFFVACILDVCV